MSKKINETSTGAGGAVGGFAGAMGTKPLKRKNEQKVTATVTTGAVYDRENKKNGLKGEKKKGFKLFKMSEKRSERALREAIRSLVFLNRVKYHEEQVKRELQEQKLRKVIRHLLSESKSNEILLTTGENNASDFINNITSTTFDQLYAKLSSTEAQRIAFRETYLAKLKLYLDSLDQQHMILNPSDKPTNPESIERPQDGNEPGEATTGLPSPEQELGGLSGAGEELPGTEQGLPDLGGGEGLPGEEEAGLQEAVGPTGPASSRNVVADTSRLQKQVIATELSVSELDPTGIEQAQKALEKDLPQIDSLYSQLTFKPLKLPTGEVTSDRELFRKMLFGGVNDAGEELDGNLDISFNSKDKDVATSDKPTAQPAKTQPAANPKLPPVAPV